MPLLKKHFSLFCLKVVLDNGIDFFNSLPTSKTSKAFSANEAEIFCNLWSKFKSVLANNVILVLIFFYFCSLLMKQQNLIFIFQSY